MTNNSFNVIVLHQLNEKICRGTTSSIAESFMGSMEEESHNFILIKVDDFTSLSKYLDSSEQHFDVLKQSGFEAASSGIRDYCTSELVSHGQDHTTLYRTLV